MYAISHNESDLSQFDNNDEFEYTKNVQTKPAKHRSTHNKTEVVSDTIIPDTFSTGKTRIKVTESTAHHTTTVTTEVWKTKNPSYLTWQNGALVLTSAAALGIGAWAAAKGFNFYTTPTSTLHVDSQEPYNAAQNEDVQNWEAGVYDGDHATFNTQGLSADAPWSEKLAITAGGATLGYAPVALGFAATKFGSTSIPNSGQLALPVPAKQLALPQGTVKPDSILYVSKNGAATNILPRAAQSVKQPIASPTLYASKNGTLYNQSQILLKQEREKAIAILNNPAASGNKKRMAKHNLNLLNESNSLVF